MIRLTKILFSIITLLLSSQAYSQNYFDAEHSKKFAEYLLETKQYALAADEFEKVTFLLKDDLDSKLNLLRSYRLNQQADIAIQKLNDFYPSIQSMPVSFSKEYLNNTLVLKNYDEAFTILQNNNNFSQQESANFKLSLMILQKNWTQADDFYVQNSNDVIFYPELSNIMKNKNNVNYKSPLLAGSLSLLIPGMGKVYTNRWKDGLISFIFVGANAWQAYRGFKKEGSKSVYGWIMGSIAFSFYAGNVFGSIKSAKKYNKRIDENFYQEAELSIYNNL